MVPDHFLTAFHFYVPCWKLTDLLTMKKAIQMLVMFVISSVIATAATPWCPYNEIMLAVHVLSKHNDQSN